MTRQRLARFCAIAALLLIGFVPAAARASIAYGTLNNFDCVNDTGVEAHGFDIELDDIRSKDITYTYDYNHYGVPKITEDLSNPLHPKVLVRYAAVKSANGTWSAYTAIPAGPIAPTQGHQFTNPAVNFGGEHFGVGYSANPSAVRYYWLIDDGRGNLIRGPSVNVSTPTFTYFPPAVAVPAQVVAVIVPPPPPAPPPLQFGDASWVKMIKTTTHNPNKVRLQDLVADDPGFPQPWANGEPAEVEVEWKLLQTEFANAANPKGVLQGALEGLPGGDEVVTRRYEFYKYTGPLDAETGEAMADAVAADGKHGVGSVTYADHFDVNTGEWVTVTVDLSTLVVVGDFFGAQMSGFDVAPKLGLIDHIQDGQINVPYADRTVVVAGGAPFLARVKSGALPNGMALDQVTGVLSGTPTAAGVSMFTVEATDTTNTVVSQAYTVTIAGNGIPVGNTITTGASPANGGTTVGGGVYNNGSNVMVSAIPNAGFAFVNWTEGGVAVSALASYNFVAGGNRTLIANFARVTYTVSTSASPTAGGSASGGGTFNSGDSVTVVALPNAGYSFVNWTEGGTAVSASVSYNFTASANRTLVANFARITYTISTSAAPAAGGSASGTGTYNSGDSVTVVATPNAGFTFVNWTEGGVAASATASYTFTASANRSLTANFAVIAPTITLRQVYVLSPIIGGFKTVAAVVLSAPAPAGGTKVLLMSSNSILGVPASVIVPAGHTIAPFVATSSKVKATTTITVTATLGTSQKSDTVKVIPLWSWWD